MVGDFNLHHPSWNSLGRYSYHAMADKLLDYTTKKGMSLGTPEGTVTWRSRGLQSAIDLTFLTEGAYYAISSCRVKEDLYYRLDHWLIATELEWSREETPTRIRRAWKKIEDETVKEDIRKGLGILNRALGRPALTVPTDVDQYTGKLVTGLLEIIEITVPITRLSLEAKSYWNHSCTKTTKEARAHLKEYHRGRSTYTEEALKEAEYVKVRTIRKAKALAFREGVHKVSLKPTGVWRLARWGRQKSRKPKELP